MYHFTIHAIEKGNVTATYLADNREQEPIGMAPFPNVSKAAQEVAMFADLIGADEYTITVKDDRKRF